MSGHRPFAELIKHLSKAHRARIESMKAGMLEEMRRKPPPAR